MAASTDGRPSGSTVTAQDIEVKAGRLSCCSKEGVCVSVGVLGHVDSGKTSLCRALSQIISTCGLDKHPQSKERGITLDLGFSAFSLSLPANPHRCFKSPDTPGITKTEAERANDSLPAAELAARQRAEGHPAGTRESDWQQQVQICLVDCPGHASLVKTVIGGSHIIDMALLVIDATKGVQAQTAECIIICQVIRKPILVVLNKTDLIADASRQQKIKVLTGKMRRVLEGLGFGPAVPVVAVSAAPSTNEGVKPRGIAELKEALAEALLSPSLGVAEQTTDPQQMGGLTAGANGGCLVLQALNRQRCSRCLCCLSGGLPKREVEPLLFCSDHAFAVKGKGTVVTGTVLRGRVAVGDTVTFVSSATAGVVAPTAKVKGIQRFRKEASEARSGQRAAVCLAGVNSSNVERGLLTAPGAVPPILKACIASVRLITIFQLPVESEDKFHCTLGHLTVIATAHFFKYLFPPKGARKSHRDLQPLSESEASFDSALVYEEAKCLTKDKPEAFALLSFERPVVAPMGSALLGSRLDVEASLSMCRLAFEGRVLRPVSLPPSASGATSAPQTQCRGVPTGGPAKAEAGDRLKGQRTAAAAGEAGAAAVPLPLSALCVVRRKWRVGSVDRFAPDGACPACTCAWKASSVPDAPKGEPNLNSSTCEGACAFRSTSLVVRGLFKDAHHARRFTGFSVALLEMTKEEAERHLVEGEGSALYQACTSVCLPSLNRTQPKSSDHCTLPAVASSSGGGAWNAGSTRPAGEEGSFCDGITANPMALLRPGVVAAAYGGKGKCHVDLLSPLTCSEASGSSGLAAQHFCVALLYCKSCFDKQKPLLQP